MPAARHYTYDGFGNLTGRTGSGTAQSTTISTPADPTTNRPTGYSYDANGNQISTGYTYDSENRIAFANAGTVEYFYDGQNKRIWQGNCNSQLYFCPGTVSSDLVSLFGADGKLIATYQPIPSQSTISFYMTQERSYFGGKLVGQLTGPAGSMQAAVQDRLGSVGKYYPYGEERNTPQLTNDQVKFATYTRDSATGLDYADQRFYASAFGRFMTVDPSGDAWDPADPQSWNNYTYVSNDPINSNDPTGLIQCGDLNVVGGGTVRDYLNASGDAGKLTRFVWAEGGTLAASGGSQDALTLSMMLIAQAIENRLAVANGEVAVAAQDGNIYWGNGGLFNHYEDIKDYISRRVDHSAFLCFGPDTIGDEKVLVDYLNLNRCDVCD